MGARWRVGCAPWSTNHAQPPVRTRPLFSALSTVGYRVGVRARYERTPTSDLMDVDQVILALRYGAGTHGEVS